MSLRQSGDESRPRYVLWLWDAALAGLTFAVVAPPLLTARLPYDHDLVHLFRMVYAEDALRQQGLWSWRWMPSMARGYGYPLFNYYAPGAVYLSAVLTIAAGSFALAKSLTGLSLLIFGWVAMWLWVRSRWAPEAAAPAAALYTLAPYHLLDIHVRGAYSEALALSIVPAVLWAGERAWMTGKRRFIVAGGCLWALIVLSHNLSAMVFSALFLLYFAIVAVAEKNRRPAAGAMAMFAVAVGLAAFFWLPAVAEAGEVRLDRITSKRYDFRDHFVYFPQFFQRDWGLGLSVPGPDDEMSFQIGLVHVIILSVSVALYFGATGCLRRADFLWMGFWQCVAVASVVLMMQVSVGLWELVRPLQLLQFPWRLLGVVMLAASALVAPVLHRIPLPLRWLAGVAVVALAIGAYYPCCKVWYWERPDQMFGRNLSVAVLQTDEIIHMVTTTVENEYLPRTVEEFPAHPPKSDYDATTGVEVTDFAHRRNTYRFHVRAADFGQIVLHQFAFPGWRASVNGEPAAIFTIAPHGEIGLEVPAGKADVTVWFGATPSRQVGRAISVLTVLGIMVWLAVGRRRLKSGKERAVNSVESDKLPEGRGAYPAIGKRCDR